MKESDHYENEMYFVKSDCFSTYVDMYRGGVYVIRHNRGEIRRLF